MQYVDFLPNLNKLTVFSLRDILKVDPGFYNRRLNEWQQKGYIKKIRRGYYIFSGLPITEESLFLIANRIYSPSYVSMESALSYYGLIPEGAYSITSVSTRKTTDFTDFHSFSYRSIRPEAFFGYRLHKLSGQPFKIAEIEKAVLDYLYLTPSMNSLAAFSEWRFNSEAFLAQADMNKFQRYLDLYDSTALRHRAKYFLNYLEAQHVKS
jgi:predicted transcriptional regulator of viral defense system